MKFAPMNYHYLRYPLTKFLDKVERSPFDSIDLYCSAPQLNLFDHPLSHLLELDGELRRRHLSVAAMTPENCVYPVNFCTQDRQSFWAVPGCRSAPASGTLMLLGRRRGTTAGNLWHSSPPTQNASTSPCCWKS